MDFSLSEEQQATGELARQIFGDRCTHEHLRTLERSGAPRFDRELWSALADAGLLGIAVPEAHGGAGLGMLELAQILEAAGRHAAPVPLWETLALGALPLARYGSDDLASAWLPRVADGSVVLTTAWQEDDGGGGHDVTTTATADGAGFRLDGAKVSVPAAQIADAVLVEAAGPDGPGLYLVEVGEGVEVIPASTTAGSPTGHLHLAGVPAALVCSGESAVRWAFERAVGTQCALALGHAEAMLDLLSAYTKERKQFDVPIASFQAVGHRAADSYIDTEAIRLTTLQAVSRLHEDLPATVEVSVAKYWAAWSGQRITLAAAHLHGGVGADRDYPLARHFTAMKELELDLGGATQHLLRVGAELAAG